MTFKEIPIEECRANFVDELENRYCLVSATNGGKTNMLTAAWAQVGFLWQRPVASVYIRPSRYTKEFMDASGRFTISFIEGHDAELYYLGRHSGRDEDKLAATSLNLVNYEGDPIYEEAKLALICRIIYVQQLDLSCVLDPTVVQNHYPEGNVSMEYIGQIEKVVVPEQAQ